MLVVLIPLAAVIYPIFKLLPGLYDWIMRSRIERLYSQMRSIEAAIDNSSSGFDSSDVEAKLDYLENVASHLSLPASYGGPFYTLRSHIGLIRARFEAVRAKNNVRPSEAGLRSHQY
jgi:hypothetical protein